MPTATVIKNPVTLLRRARDLLSDPKRWTQGAPARRAGDRAGKRGRPVNPRGPEAVSWCLSGALSACSAPGSPARKGATKALTKACLEVRSYPSFVWANDQGTHGDVLRLLDRAIEIADG